MRNVCTNFGFFELGQAVKPTGQTRNAAYQSGCIITSMLLSQRQRTYIHGDHSFSKRICHDLSVSFRWPKKMKIMTYRHNIFFQTNDTQLTNAYQN